MPRWFIKADGLNPPMEFSTEAEALTWADENVAAGGYTIVKEEDNGRTGTFDDIPPA